MPDYKRAIFMFEAEALPDDLKVVKSIAEEFQTLPEARTTLVQVAHTLEEAAPQLDNFKALMCGSSYSLAVINLNMMTRVEEIDFLLRRDVLGDPRTIFLGSLRYLVGEAYALAREKVQRENQNPKGHSPSCLDCYSAHNREEAAPRVSGLAVAYLHELEELEKARREGRILAGQGQAAAFQKKSATTFFGGTMKSGEWKSVNVTGTGRFPKVGGSPPAAPAPPVAAAAAKDNRPPELRTPPPGVATAKGQPAEPEPTTKSGKFQRPGGSTALLPKVE